MRTINLMMLAMAESAETPEQKLLKLNNLMERKDDLEKEINGKYHALTTAYKDVKEGHVWFDHVEFIKIELMNNEADYAGVCSEINKLRGSL